MKGSLPKLVLIVALTVSAAGCTQVIEDLRENVQPRGGPGSNYEAYLTGQRTLLIELDHSPGAKWDTGTQVDEDFRRQVEKITQKNVEIRTSRELPDNGEDYAWSTSELRELHSQHQDFSSDQSRVVMHALFLAGDFERERTVGLAYDADAFALFMGKIDEITCSNGALVCDRTERWKAVRAISIHEAGHLFGLVNSPLPMVQDHEDPEHEAHSTNDDSVMFHKVETARGLSDLFGDGIPYKFDSNDLQDARNQRGGSR